MGQWRCRIKQFLLVVPRRQFHQNGWWIMLHVAQCRFNQYLKWYSFLATLLRRSMLVPDDKCRPIIVDMMIDRITSNGWRWRQCRSRPSSMRLPMYIVGCRQTPIPLLGSTIVVLFFFLIFIIITFFNDIRTNVPSTLTSLFPTHGRRMSRQHAQSMMQGGKITIRLEQNRPIERMNHHGDTDIDHKEWMTDQERIKESFDQIGIPNVMGEPRNDPRQTKKGFHVTILQVVVQLWIQLGQEREYRPMQTLLQTLKGR
mmetsp:Transcript_2273/g.5163  ORF Transcript_2273/g.5163 Transcript_2273/m.5163 type:complete len:257 (-) Transcript_2273:985-1755(-)